MITKTQSFQTSDGKLHDSISAAQVHEMAALIDSTPVDKMAQFLVEQKDKVVDILTMTTRSKPRARAINGGTRKRTPRAVAVNQNANGPEPV